MTELDFKDADSAVFLGGLRKAEGLLELSPHGMRWHAAFSGEEAMRRALSGLPAGALCEIIKPSLEDVFIRLVEGAER
jgi:hypothetical protein